MQPLKEKFNQLPQGTKLLISLISFIFAEINLLISIVLISNFVSAVNDLPSETKEYAKYCNPNFFRSRNGILTMDLFLFFIILSLLVIIFIQKNQYVNTLNFSILFFLFIRFIISLVFLGDPNESYISTMREGYYNNVIQDTYQENINYKAYYDSWDSMYENEILQFFLLNIPIMVGAFILQAVKLDTLPIRDQFSFQFNAEPQQSQQVAGYNQNYNYRQFSQSQAQPQQQQYFHNEGPPVAFGTPIPASTLYRNYSNATQEQQQQQQQQLQQQQNSSSFFPIQQNPPFNLPKKQEDLLQEEQQVQKQQQESALQEKKQILGEEFLNSIFSEKKDEVLNQNQLKTIEF